MYATHERFLGLIEDLRFSLEINSKILNLWDDNKVILLERLSNMATQLKQENNAYELSKLMFFVDRWGEYCTMDYNDLQTELFARKKELNEIVYAMKDDPSLMPLYEEKRDALNSFMSSL